MDWPFFDVLWCIPCPCCPCTNCHFVSVSLSGRLCLVYVPTLAVLLVQLVPSPTASLCFLCLCSECVYNQHTTHWLSHVTDCTHSLTHSVTVTECMSDQSWRVELQHCILRQHRELTKVSCGCAYMYTSCMYMYVCIYVHVCVVQVCVVCVSDLVAHKFL